MKVLSKIRLNKLANSLLEKVVILVQVLDRGVWFIYLAAPHAFWIKTSCKSDSKNTKKFFFVIYAYLVLASTKSSYSPIWRVQNLFGEYEIEVTRQFGEYEFFLMSNPGFVLICPSLCSFVSLEDGYLVDATSFSMEMNTGLYLSYSLQ